MPSMYRPHVHSLHSTQPSVLQRAPRGVALERGLVAAAMAGALALLLASVPARAQEPDSTATPAPAEAEAPASSGPPPRVVPAPRPGPAPPLHAGPRRGRGPSFLRPAVADGASHPFGSGAPDPARRQAHRARVAGRGPHPRPHGGGGQPR